MQLKRLLMPGKVWHPLLFSILLYIPTLSFSQSAPAKGKVVDENGKPMPNVKVQLPSGSTVTTDSKGEFNTNEKKATEKTVPSTSTIVQTPDTGVANESITNAYADNVPTITESDEEESSSSSESVASVLGASRDVFQNAANFNFSMARFRVRGYDDENNVTLMNGVPMNDLANGRSLYNSWSGLNDVMRNREVTNGLGYSYYSFGDVGGTNNIDSRASHQRKQLQVSYAISNRQYDNRFMLTYGSGLLKGDWAYSLSYTRRWAEEGYVKGTFYDGHSYFASIEKFIGNHSLSLTAMGAPTKNGRGSTATEEMYQLADDHYYNRNWGYQQGKKRNAVVADNHQPFISLTHDWKLNDKSTIESAVGYSFGKNRYGSFDWFNAPSPYPDYYRNLPSFDPSYGADPAAWSPYYQQILERLRGDEDNRQVNWAGIYAVNEIHDTTYNGTSGKMAHYVLSDRVADNKRFSFNSFYNNTVSDHMKLTLGLAFQSQATENYKEVTDLLGADFFVNLNQFVDLTNPTQQSISEYDLNDPDRIVRKGDRYAYDYVAHIIKETVWGQSFFTFPHFDYMIGVNVNNTRMFRDGKYRNGVYLNDSYGESRKYDFPDAGVKGGVTYKYNGRNYFYANALFETRAPYFDHLFPSPQTNNRTVQADDETIKSVEGGYMLKAPKVRGRITGYLTQYNDETITRRFYNDDFNTFVNYTLLNVDKRHVGAEAAAEASVGKGFSVNAVASIGQFFYTSRPSAWTTQDSKDSILQSNETIYLKDLHLSNGPERAYSLGVRYNSPHFWYANASINVFDGIFYDASYTRRTIKTLDLVDAGSPLWDEILRQRQAPGGYSLDVSWGWSWRLNNRFKALTHPTYFVINIGVNNVTDYQDYIVTAREPLRFDFADKDVSKFDPKIAYAYGRNYFINIALRMN